MAANNSNSAHFARQLARSFGANLTPYTSCNSTCESRAFTRGFSATSAGHAMPTMPLPSCSGVKLNAGKFQVASSGVSVFDVHGAIDAIQNGPDDAARKRMHPAMVAHGARMARAQQQSATLLNIKLFPDLTPGRAFMWGSILAVYAVTTTTVVAARSLGIYSVHDVKDKMREHFAPVTEYASRVATEAKEGMKLSHRPEAIESLQRLGATMRRTFGAKALEEQHADAMGEQLLSR